MWEQNRDLFVSFVHIGGMAKTGRSKTDWYWVNSNSKVSYNMTWHNGQPDFSGDDEWCLSLGKGGQFRINDITCYGGWKEKFICESIKIAFNFDLKIFNKNIILTPTKCSSVTSSLN